MKFIDFDKKIVLIYEFMCNSDVDELQKYFSDEQEKSPQDKADRKKTIKNWIYKGIKTPKQFYYDEYFFSTFHFPNGDILFTEDEFKAMPFELFKSTIEKYILMTKEALELNYNYIYYFNTNVNDVKYLKLHMKQKLSPNKYEITLFSEDLGANYQIYRGTLEKVENYIYINVENDFERINFSFMKNQGIQHHNQLYGISLGKAYETGVPKATKSILTIEKLEEKDEEQSYFYLNETEILLADEAIETTFDKANYIKKFDKKIHELKKYVSRMRKLLSHTIKSDVYLSIFHKQFISFNEMSYKVLHSKKYHLASRRRATKVFLQSLSHKKDVYGVIVYPIFSKDATLFNESSIDSKKSLEFNIRYAQNGLKLFRIFVIENKNQITDYVKTTIHQLEESGIDVKIVLLEDIKESVSSYDFIFGSDEEVVLYREVQDRTCHFKVNKDKENINVIMNDYHKIKSQCFTLEEL